MHASSTLSGIRDGEGIFTVELRYFLLNTRGKVLKLCKRLLQLSCKLEVLKKKSDDDFFYTCWLGLTHQSRTAICISITPGLLEAASLTDTVLQCPM